MPEPNLASSALVTESNPSALQDLSDGRQPLDAVEPVVAERVSDAAAIHYAEPLQRYLNAWATAHHEISTIDPGFIAALFQQITAALESQRQHWEQEQGILQVELRQARSLCNEQIERIRHLEQALDQSLASLREMRLQVVDQHLLEAQLASTEEISNIQQRAIARLRLQLSQQQQALIAQQTETQDHDRSLQTLLTTMEALTQEQQQALDQLRTQLTSDRAEVRTYQQRVDEQLGQLQTDPPTQQEQTVALEHQSPDAPTLTAHLTVRLGQAHAQASTLSQLLSARQSALTQLEAELQQAHLALKGQQAWLDRLQQSYQSHAPTAATTPAIVLPDAALAITPDLVAAHAKIAALEAQAAKQTTTQAMLRHACQELEEERDRQHDRLTELENQTTEMQEQILRQAQQTSEYETAIQHWKDRCFSSHNGMLQLQALLDQSLPEPSAAVSELLAALLAATDETEPTSPTLSPMTALQREKVDLPDFLLRRRNYKTRRS